jgi:uncharacterized protein with FMN-binding domain
MKRAILITMGTIAGATAVLGYQPGAILGTSARAAEPATTSTSATTTDTSTSAQTYTGDTVQTRFGPVQVQATVEAGKVTAVTTLSYPNSDGRSAQINAQAVPALEQQAVAAQSASIDGVSGASYTSAAFEQSLQSALVQAGLA